MKKLFKYFSFLLICILAVVAPACEQLAPSSKIETTAENSTKPVQLILADNNSLVSDKGAHEQGVSSLNITIDGSQWKLISLNGNPLIKDSYISLYFRSGTYWGFSGANTYGAKYSLQDQGGIFFSDYFMTNLGGPEDILWQERDYLKCLVGENSYHFENEHLMIINPNFPKPLIFERIPEYPVNSAAIIGTKWQLISLNGEPVPEGVSITLSFDNETQASGQAGCFAYKLFNENTLYKPTGDDIRWGISGSRTGDLSQELEIYSASYLGCIEEAANFRLIESKLEIFTARGETLIYESLIDMKQ